MLTFKVVTCKTLNETRRRRMKNGVIIYELGAEKLTV
jgi:hypothetical protein